MNDPDQQKDNTLALVSIVTSLITMVGGIAHAYFTYRKFSQMSEDTRIQRKGVKIENESTTEEEIWGDGHKKVTHTKKQVIDADFEDTDHQKDTMHTSEGGDAATNANSVMRANINNDSNSDDDGSDDTTTAITKQTHNPQQINSGSPVTSGSGKLAQIQELMKATQIFSTHPNALPDAQQVKEFFQGSSSGRTHKKTKSADGSLMKTKYSDYGTHGSSSKQEVDLEKGLTRAPHSKKSVSIQEPKGTDKPTSLSKTTSIETVKIIETAPDGTTTTTTSTNNNNNAIVHRNDDDDSHEVKLIGFQDGNKPINESDD